MGTIDIAGLGTSDPHSSVGHDRAPSAATQSADAAVPHSLPQDESLAHLVQGTVCKILAQEEVKPHKVRYYLERRDAEFEQKMAEVLCVYREVRVLKKATKSKSKKTGKPVAVISYDEKRGTNAWLAARPAGRFEFTFTPTRGSWLNLIEGFFSKFARSVLRHIRVASKQEFKERIMAGIVPCHPHVVLQARRGRLI
jgi:hypothetical protein